MQRNDGLAPKAKTLVTTRYLGTQFVIIYSTGNREVKLHHACLADSFINSNQGERWYMVHYRSGSSHLAECSIIEESGVEFFEGSSRLVILLRTRTAAARTSEVRIGFFEACVSLMRTDNAVLFLSYHVSHLFLPIFYYQSHGAHPYERRSIQRNTSHMMRKALPK
jgi:hypothetical protein